MYSIYQQYTFMFVLYICTYIYNEYSIYKNVLWKISNIYKSRDNGI